MTANELVQTLENAPETPYVLLFFGTEVNDTGEEFSIGHAVIPYRVDQIGDEYRVYFWDNNVPHPFIIDFEGETQYSYNQYITVDQGGNWYSSEYKWETFTKLSLLPLETLYNNGSHLTPLIQSDNSTTLTLSGSSNITVSDSFGNISGFVDGVAVEEIPGVQVIIPLNATLSGAVDTNIQ
ncbi:hypothetical protein MK079_04570, partial [Candidatus Gracilibacteria bacterium]|nr:hypothetical protein [Candidatus Gracilibacteria bacterium]